MTATENPKPTRSEAFIGPGQFQWSTGGWYGALVGGSAWIFLGAIVLAKQSTLLAGIWSACGIVSTLVGLWLWSQRANRAPFPALMSLMLVLWISACVSLVSMLALAPEALRQFGASKGMILAGLLIFPMMIIQFSFLERRALSQASRRDRQGDS